MCLHHSMGAGVKGIMDARSGIFVQLAVRIAHVAHQGKLRLLWHNFQRCILVWATYNPAMPRVRDTANKNQGLFWKAGK